MTDTSAPSRTQPTPLGNPTAVSTATEDAPSRFGFKTGFTKPDRKAVEVVKPGLAKTNLLPERYLKAAEKKTRTIQMAGGIAAALVVLLLAWLAQSGQISSAQGNLDNANADLTTVTGQAHSPRLLAASQFYDQVNVMEQTASKVMSNEVLYSRVLTAFGNDTPGGISFTSLSIATPGYGSATGQPTAAASGNSTCAQPDPFHTAATLGCVTFGGEATSRSVVTALLNNLNRDKGFFVNPFVQSVTSGSGKMTVNGTVSLVPTVLSGRYAAYARGAIPGIGVVPGTRPSTGTSRGAPVLPPASTQSGGGGLFSSTYLLIAVVLALLLGGALVLRKRKQAAA